MNGYKSGNVQNMDNPIPGCLGKMVDLFDLGTSVRGNKLLTHEPHPDSSSLSRSRSDVAQMQSSFNGDHREPQLIMSDLRRSASNGTSMKTHIAHELSKGADHKQSPTNVVAKLMGLDPLPLPQLDTDLHRIHLNHSESSMFHNPQRCREQRKGEFKHVYETKEPRKEANFSKGRKYGESMKEKQRDLVRKSFMEAKRLVTDEKLHGSKEFQDALEILSSNKNLFVDYLQESNSFFSHHLSDIQPIVLERKTKHITVLRPSKAVDAENSVVRGRRSKQIRNSASSANGSGWDDRYPWQPARIVVLKPSSWKGYSDEPEDAEWRDKAKDITWKMRENLSITSSVKSNGYIGDESSCNVSDSEMMSPVWNGRFRDNVSRASLSPESSVCREAKKRLSERWAMMALNGNTQRHKHTPRSSSTLGEMLALSEANISSSCIIISNGSMSQEEERASDSIKPLKPLSSSSSSLSSSSAGVGTHISVPEASKEMTESRSLKSSWKVSSFFFFKNKKVSNQQNNSPQAMRPSTCDHFLPLEDFPSPHPLQQPNIFPGEEESARAKASNENQDQPSPISVLQPPFEEECCGTRTSGLEMSLESNLIGKSPLIGSIARTLSWDDDSTTDISRSVMHEDEDWYVFVQTLLAAKGLSGDISSDMLLVRWHSPESPLDPSLRDKHPDPRNNQELVHEVEHRQQRSTRKLIFDSINTIIAEATAAAVVSGTSHTGRGRDSERLDLVGHAWSQLKDWVSDKTESRETEESNSSEAEKVVRAEVAGSRWEYDLKMEMNELRIEIERRLLQELVEEAIIHLMEEEKPQIQFKFILS